MNRRSFLQLLGIGGLAAAGVTLPVVGGGSALWTPGQRKWAGNHLILMQPKRTGTRAGTDRVGRRQIRIGPRWPKIHPDAKIYHATDMDGASAGVSLRGGHGFFPHELTQHVPVPPGTDPHVEFLLACESLRDKISEMGRRTINQMTRNPHFRSQAMMVTVVLTPLMATPNPHAGHMPESRETELWAMAQFAQFITFDEVEANGLEVLSEFGEFPIDPPSDLDLALIQRLASDVQADRPLEQQLAAARARPRHGRAPVDWGARAPKFELNMNPDFLVKG